MSAQAIPKARPLQDAPSATRRTRPGRARIGRLPGPESLLHPRAAEALVLAFRPLSWSR
jgi:hypothetical protein